MRLGKANIAGLNSPAQQAEMKSILAGTWPPLKPLPVFRYETVEYRATIDFDRRRGEWVCRKTSLPSNRVQELRGGLREVTMALPQGQAETFGEELELQEQELAKDTNRRLQAIHEWQQHYESGALYCQLQDYLLESQRTEMHDSLRLSLTARQLQFSAKNVAQVFEALSTAGGRFAALLEFAKRCKAKRAPTVPRKESEQKSEDTVNQDAQSIGSTFCKSEALPGRDFAEDEDASGHCRDLNEFPAVSITNVLPEQDQACSAEQLGLDTASRKFDFETSERVDTDSSAVMQDAYQEARHSPAAGFVGPDGSGRSPAIDIGGAPSRFPALEISASQVAVTAILFLFAVLAFAVGLTLGHGPLGNRFRDIPKSMLAADSNTPSHPSQVDQSTSAATTLPVTNSTDAAGVHRLDDVKPVEEKSKYLDLAPATESRASAEPEGNSDRGGAMEPFVPENSVRQSLTPSLSAALHLPKSSAILVTLPSPGSQPFRVSFPEKALAATSSFAMTSQFSVVVPAVPGAAMAHKPSRLEAGELVSFVWPRYPMLRDRYGSAETIGVRATIGQLGQVLEVKFLNGSVSLLPATTRAIRQWRYRPTLLDKRPVKAQQDVTIEFRPPQYSSKASGSRSLHR